MNRLWFSFVFTFIAFIFFSPRAQTAEPARSSQGVDYAILFGVETFPNLENFSDLSGAVNDMTALRDRWLNAPKFEGRVFSLTEGEDGLVPTRANFERTLDDVSKLTSENDALYVCIATHGIAALSRSFLCPQDATGADLSDATPETLEQKAKAQGLISVSTILDKLSKTPGRKVLIFDACREKAPTDRETDFLQEFEERLRGREHLNLAVISSCCLGQYASEIRTETGGARGAFFHYFLEGLEGKADLTGAYDGQITLIEAYNHANERTKRAAQALGRAQTPELYEANDSKNPNGVDRLVLTSRDLFAEQFDAETLALESDALFAARTGDYLVKTQSELKSRDDKGDYPLVEDVFDFVLKTQPGNRLARNLRGYARRAQGDYAGALADFKRIGAELVLFAASDPAEPTMARLNACPVYPSATANRRKSGQAFNIGSLLVVDQVKNGRARVVSWNSKPTKDETWISVDAAVWSRRFAETAIVGSAATPTRNVDIRSVPAATSSTQTTGSPAAAPGGSQTFFNL